MRLAAAAGLLLGLLPAGGSRAQPASLIDPGLSQLGFEIQTRFGYRLSGRFPAFHGQVRRLDDGRQQVELVIDARQAEVGGHPRLTELLRGPDFFDVQHHPDIVFRSAPHPPGLAGQGGRIAGELVLRGVSGELAMELEPAGCGRPGYDCPVAGRGTVSRAAYGMDGWQLAVSDRVTFVLQVRLGGAQSL